MILSFLLMNGAIFFSYFGVVYYRICKSDVVKYFPIRDEAGLILMY